MRVVCNRDGTHGQVVVGDAVAGRLAADAQEDRPAGGAVVVQEFEVPLLESPMVLRSPAARRQGERAGAHKIAHGPFNASCKILEKEGGQTHGGGEVVKPLVHPPLVPRQVPACGVERRRGP